RRRHTRFSRDWSSDVCSSDLVGSPGESRWSVRLRNRTSMLQLGQGDSDAATRPACWVQDLILKVASFRQCGHSNSTTWGWPASEIGRASCREKVVMSGGGVHV